MLAMNSLFLFLGMSLSRFHFLKIALLGIELPLIVLFSLSTSNMLSHYPLASIVSDEKPVVNIIGIPL